MAKNSLYTKFVQDYTVNFEVELPDGESVALEFRLPSAAQVWQIEREMGAYPQPDGSQPPIDIKPHPERPGKYAHIYAENDPVLTEKRNAWNDELQLRRILACWTEEIPGATTEEKIDALRKLPFYLVEALKICVRQVVRVSGDSIKERPFLGK